MRSTISCAACGTVLGVPKAGMPRAGLPCNWCGYVNLPSMEATTAAPPPVTRPVTVPASTAPAPTEPTPKDKPAPHRWADDADDNGQPYALPPDEVKKRKCEGCGKL